MQKYLNGCCRDEDDMTCLSVMEQIRNNGLTLQQGRLRLDIRENAPYHRICGESVLGNVQPPFLGAILGGSGKHHQCRDWFLCMPSQAPAFSGSCENFDVQPVEVATGWGTWKVTCSLPSQAALEAVLYLAPKFWCGLCLFSWGPALPSYALRCGENSPLDFVPFISICLWKLKLITGSLLLKRKIKGLWGCILCSLES